jgi:BatD DUF11 like domain
MRKQIIILATLLGMLAYLSPARAEVSVRATVDRTAVAPGESIQLQVTVSGGGGDVDLSGLDDFKVLSQGTSSNVQIVNGHFSRETTYNYMILARRQGRLTIPALAVDVDGQIYHSEPIDITVTRQPDTGNDRFEDKEAWVTAEVSDSTPYEGQQITYTFRLYNTVQIQDAQFQAPAFDGFSAKEVKDRRNYRKIINGREVMVTEINYILSPLKPGSQSIDSAVLQVGILRADRSGRQWPLDKFFNDPFFNRGSVQTRILQTDPVKVAVQPLPPPAADSKFAGLVGHFDLHAGIEGGGNLKVGDSATLAVTVEGRGNIMDAQPPALQIPPAFKTYADNPQESVDMDRTGFHGKKIFRTALVPLQAGRFQLAPVTLTYFDVDQKAYRTLTAAVPALTVAASLQTAAPPVAIAPPPIKPLKEKVTFTGRDILPLKENLTAIQPHRPFSWMLFLLGLAAPALAFGGTVLVQRLRRQDTRPAALMRARAHQALKAAQKGPQDKFLSLLYQALTAAILAGAGRMGEALTWKEAETLLRDSGRTAEEARSTAELLSRIESCKFSGGSFTSQEHDELLIQTRQAIRKLVP